ncbi:MAG TPA: hypothetical protein ENJ44_07105, partial [Oceanospirillales bacterium]|nr:hypothetical protein [Oceanospirillales bacterium]
MSDNKSDDKHDSIHDNDEQIATELQGDEISLELDAENLADESFTTANQVQVVKKGSFLASLSFLMSLAALLIAAYLFYLQQNLPPKDTSKTFDTENIARFQQEIKQLKSDYSNKLDKIASRIDGLAKNTEALSKQLEVFKANTTSSNNIDSSNNTNYDDSAIVARINSLEKKLEHNSNATSEGNLEPKLLGLEEKIALQQDKITQLKDNFSSTLNEHEQNIAKLNSEVAKKDQKQTNVVALGSKKYPLEVAQTYLKVAAIQLNTNGNIRKAQELLEKTQQELKLLKNMPKAQTLSGELSSFITQLKNINKPDFDKITKTIDSLSNQASQLNFPNSKVKTSDEEKNKAWYNKLVVVRKIDDNQQANLTKSDQFAIMQSIRTNFDMLKVALL